MGWVRAMRVDVVVAAPRRYRRIRYIPHSGQQRVRLRKGLGEQPRVAIVTNSCDLPLDSPVFTAGPSRPIVLTSRVAPPDRVSKVASRADVLFAGEDAVDPSRAVQMLRSEFGIERILLEGGPTLNYYFLRQRVVDEFFWTVAPKLIGGGRAVFGRRAGRIRPVRSA